MSSWISNSTGRLDVLVATQETAYSRSRIQRLIEAGHVSLNTKTITSPKHIVQIGDALEFRAPEADPLYPQAEHQSLDIIFEDADIIVINKPVGMVVHPNDFHDQGTLVHALLGLRPELSEAVYDPENPVSRLRPGIVHRLDKDTSGVIVVAKTRESLTHLAEQFQNHTIAKEYQALVYGELKKQTVDAPIYRKGGGDKNKMGASHNRDDGRHAITHFEPLKTWVPYSAWPSEVITHTAIRIETGRTHQIRVHSKFIGHPILGDSLYGNKPSQKLSEALGITHQMLHASRITITHPSTGRILTLEAPLPESFNILLT